MYLIQKLYFIFENIIYIDILYYDMYSLGEPPHSESKGNSKSKDEAKSKAKSQQRQRRGKAWARQQHWQVLVQLAHLRAI